MPSKRRKNEEGKGKKRGGEKVKSKSQDCCVTFKHKNYLKILLSVQAQTSKANILHLAWRVRPVNGFVVSFSSLWHDSDQKTTQLQNTFFNKISRGKKILRNLYNGDQKCWDLKNDIILVNWHPLHSLPDNVELWAKWGTTKFLRAVGWRRDEPKTHPIIVFVFPPCPKFFWSPL